MVFKHTEYTERIFEYFEKGLGNAFVVAVAGSGKTTSLIEMLKYFNANPYKFPIAVRRGFFLYVAFSKSIKEELSNLIPVGLKREWERRVHKLIDDLCAHAEMGSMMGRSFHPTLAINEICQAIDFWQTRYPQGTCEESDMLDEMNQCIDDGEWDVLYELSSRFIKLLPDIDVKTFHGLGYLILANHFEKADLRIKLDEHKYSNLSRQAISNGDNRYSKDDYKLVFATLKKLQELCRLNFTDVNDPKEVRDIAINYDVDIGQKYPRLMLDVIRLVPEVVNRGVKSASDSGEIDYTDMVYLPIKWDLNPDYPYDFIFVDEAQDLSSITRALTYEKSLVKTGRAFFVGDPKQCQPAGTIIKTFNGRGKPAIDKPIEELKVGDRVVSYDRRSSYYVRGADVTAVSKRQYDGALYKISANGNSTFCTDNHKWLVRWNVEANKEYKALYIMQKGCHYRVGQTQFYVNGGDKRRGCLQLGALSRATSEKADKVWIIGVYSEYEEAVLEENYISAYYGLPQMTFRASNGSRLTQAMIDAFYDRFDDDSLKENASNCLMDYGRSIEHPLVDRSLKQGQWGGTTNFVVHACNLIPDYMELVVPDKTAALNHKRSFKDEWHSFEVSVEHEWSGEVYSLNVDKYELYIADGILTHNSIMQFAGSEIDSVRLTIDHTKAVDLPLNVCYRCPTSHLELAKKLVPQIEPHKNASIGTLLCASSEQLPALVKGGDMVLCRYNAPLITMATALLGMGIPSRVKGKDIQSNIVNTVKQIENDITKKHNHFDFYNLEEYVQDWAADRIQYLMDMEANEGVIGNVYDTRDSIIAAYNGMNVDSVSKFIFGINTLFGNDSNSVMFTTVHGAKGLGRDRVFILEPSAMPSDRIGQSEWQYQQELNILYVALTRSKDFLCILGPENVWASVIGNITPTGKVEDHMLGGRAMLSGMNGNSVDYKQNLHGSPLLNPIPSLPVTELIDDDEMEDDEDLYQIVDLNDGSKLRINLTTGESEVVN